MKFHNSTSVAREHCRSWFFSLSLHSTNCKDSYKWLRFMIAKPQRNHFKEIYYWVWKCVIFLSVAFQRNHFTKIERILLLFQLTLSTLQFKIFSRKLGSFQIKFQLHRRSFLCRSFWRLSIRKYYVNVPFGVFTARTHTQTVSCIRCFDRGMQNGIGRKCLKLFTYISYSHKRN